MPIATYAFKHKPEVVEKSSSGGAFSAVAEAFFDMEPNIPKTVYGVTLDRDMNVVYESARSLEECAKFKGSKYVQSSFKGIPERISVDLREGRAVLFVGTPCFVHSLKSRLEKTNSNTEMLTCVDLICHGTPQKKYWDAYKRWLEMRYKSKMTAFLFRTNKPGYTPYTATAEFENGKIIKGTLETAVFNRLFLQHYIMCPGCFQCRYASLERKGDLTLGDFWGIEDVMPDFRANKAVSEILVNTEKGNRIIQWIQKQNGWQIAQCFSDDYIKYQNNLQQPANKPSAYEKFQQDFEKKGLEYVAKKYVGYDFLHHMAFWLRNRHKVVKEKSQ